MNTISKQNHIIIMLKLKVMLTNNIHLKGFNDYSLSMFITPNVTVIIQQHVFYKSFRVYIGRCNKHRRLHRINGKPDYIKKQLETNCIPKYLHKSTYSMIFNIIIITTLRSSSSENIMFFALTWELSQKMDVVSIQ